MKLLFVSVMSLVGLSYVTSYKILMMLAMSSKSHKNVFDPVAEELAKRGNEVTIMASVQSSKKAVPGITEHYLKENAEIFQNIDMSYFQGTVSDPAFVNVLLEARFNSVRGLLRDPEMVKILKNPESYNFDVVIIDAILNDYCMAIGHHLGIPNIILSPGIRLATQAWDMNIPHPISYMPFGLDEKTDRMTFKERFWNMVANVGYHHMRHSRVLTNYDRIVAEYLPNTPPLEELSRRVSFLITNTHPALSPPMPSMPYTAEIGGVNCRSAEPLPEDLEDFMASSGATGVIYFSLGSVTKGNAMPLEMRDKMVKAFSKLPQKVLWKYEGTIENLPKNVKLLSWAPQQDILAHKQTKLFISHGGGLSISESIYHNCPILGFPLSADQWGNMAVATEKGYGEFLDWQTFTVDELLQKIEKMLTEERYREATASFSAILKDQPQPPAERAAYWIEYVARHKGATHLRSAADNLNFFQYFLLDVIGAILLVLTLALIVIYVLLRKVCRYFCKANTSKTSPKKKTN